MIRRPQASREPRLSSAAETRRLDWLDVLRMLCALEIVGFHWLRACFANGAFGRGDPISLVDPYRSPGRGLAEAHYLLVDRSGPMPAALFNDAVGWVFGFGWETVNVFILLSGLALALQAARAGGTGRLGRWYRQRLTRVLLPFYLIAPPMVVAAYAFRTYAAGRPGTLGHLGAKVAGQLPGSLSDELAKHLLLADVTQPHFVAGFFAPAWWFVPAILVGYLVFPLLLAAFHRTGMAVWLGVALAISVLTYRLSQAGLLLENAWYFIPCQELFSFAIGIALGDRLARSDAEARVRTRLGSIRFALVATGLLVLGNVLSWFVSTYAVSSAVYTLGATGVLSFIAIRISARPAAVRLCRSVDPYHLYLLHQPLAFPLSAIFAAALGGWTTSLGIVVFLPLCFGVAAAFGWMFRRLRRMSVRTLRPATLSPSTAPSAGR